MQWNKLGLIWVFFPQLHYWTAFNLNTQTHTHALCTSVWLKPGDMGVTWHWLILRKLRWRDISSWKPVLGLLQETMQAPLCGCVCGNTFPCYCFIYVCFLFFAVLARMFWDCNVMDVPSECHCWLDGKPPFGLAPVQTIEGPAEANYITGHSSVCLCDRDTTEPQMRRARPTQARVTWRKTFDIKGTWGGMQNTHPNLHAWLVRPWKMCAMLLRAALHV